MVWLQIVDNIIGNITQKFPIILLTICNYKITKLQNTELQNTELQNYKIQNHKIQNHKITKLQSIL